MNYTLADAYLNYTKKNSNNKQIVSNLNTALIRYTLPGLGFIIPSRSERRFHPNDIKLAVEFASQISINSDIKNRLINAQDKVLNLFDLTQNNKRQQRKNLHKFVTFLAKNTNSHNKNREQKTTIPTKLIIADYSHLEKTRVKGQNKQSIALSFDHKDYKENSIYPKQELTRIKSELTKLETFFRSSLLLGKSTIERTIKEVKLLLGYLYKVKEDLSKVRLSELVDVSDYNAQIKDFESYEKYCIAIVQRQEDSKLAARKTVKFVQKFFTQYGVSGSYNKERYIGTFINIAKYLYQEITDPEEYDNYEDISVIRRLRILRRKLPKKNLKIEQPLIPWEIVIKVLLEQKRRADMTRLSVFEKERNIMTHPKRAKSAIAKSLQNFLILGFFTLVPPSRSRVIRELRLGETLKHGKYIDGAFVPRENLNNPTEAKYYIHLQPEDYKTGKIYGEWLAEFPDTKFSDGTTFYEYLNKWIYEGYRDELLGKKTHNYLFLQERSSNPMKDSNIMTEKVGYIFHGTILYYLTPHKLRTIFRTHLENIGASPQEINSAAFWMRHSPDIARKVYTKQTLDEKLSPGAKVIAKVNSEFFKDFDIPV